MAKTLLKGHISEETAYVVDDYPYGFRLRCKIRYWLETVPKRGTRFCSQTTNPKKGDKWNTPKKSTYYAVGVMFIDNDDKHVGWVAIGPGTSEKRVEEFAAEYDSVLTDHDREEIRHMRVLVRAASKVTYEVHSEGPPQSEADIKDIQSRAIGQAAKELKREGKL